ncbi:TAXI family TRAP transporter solute-binding subunit [Pseudonocardia sp. MH-G8]|uniref:TAXI family TRAP transporter solute-binding subunit n=1 Tax=Pseudonocardia sp. MH-G8 TaxID=1854588 RepID=UPI000BA14C8B|nr:TAXI family TRAP transporter solute-binding subunit [Pseudonocardia sp. MH-G8]OZM81077.1 C4-dicarboxylate ABC transporter substrate-binding protein [Pseudonocardia sp. MH-G8]
MQARSDVVDRRRVLRGLLAGVAALGALPALSGCSSPFAGVRLTLATGGTQGVYYNLGNALADVWQARLELDERPTVLSTAGSVDNLDRLANGIADLVFSQVDTAADQLVRTPPSDPRAPRALARIYDDVVHVVVPADFPAATLADLRGARVSVGAPDSGVRVIAERLLTAAGLSVATDFQALQLGINDSVEAMARHEIDAFFWSGGLPTRGVTELAALRPIRLLNLEDLITPVRAAFPAYAAGTVPAQSYGIPEPVSTLLVRNFLIVGAGMPDAQASALVEGLFAAQEQLAAVSPAALTIDLRAAIGTQPVPLHPGAERFFRDEKDP